MRLTEHADVSSDATCKEALPQTGREGLLFFYFSFCSVARWDATFCSFRGIGEGGTAFPRGAFLQGRGPLRPTICEEGWGPPLHSTLDAGAPREHGFAMLGTLVTFPSRAASRTPSIGGSGTNLAGFATLRWCEQLAFLSPEAPSGKHRLLLNRGAGITGTECVSCVGFVSGLCQGIWLC